MKYVTTPLKILLPLLVLVIAVITARTLIANRPEPVSRPQFKTVTNINATRVGKSDYPVTLYTQGTVGAAREGSVVAQVPGTITEVSPNFVNGGFFKQGEVLLQIDPRDYQIALTMAQATRAQALAALEEETARSEQAALDWKRLGRRGNPSSLTLREPQLASATAVLASADAQIQRAELDLERTTILAPYNGRVASRQIDQGQFVTGSAVLAQIYSVDSAEIRLPLTNRQLGFVELPDQNTLQTSTGVVLSASVGDQRYEWTGTLVRTEGTIDPNNRQLFTVARVEDPYSSTDNQPPLRVGQYVQAAITGKTLTDVVVIPRSALREDREVLVVDDSNTLQRREVSVRWKDADVAVIGQGLEAGEVISLTSLGTVVNGTRVQASIDGEPASSEPAGRSDPSLNGDIAARLAKLKTLVDSGGEIPAPARQRIAARIANGQPVPEWLKKAMADGENKQ